MSTKIGGFDSGQVHVGTSRTVKRAGDSGGTSKSSGASTTADTQITDSARTLASLEQTVRDLPAVDEAHVQQVSAKLANGSYEINPERIADKLLRSEQDLSQLG